MLKDSGYIHEKEAEWKNKKAVRAGKPEVQPLYTYNDAVDSLKYVYPVLYDQLIKINDEISIVFNDAGHILGSAIVEVWATENDKTSKIVFSGDLSNNCKEFLLKNNAFCGFIISLISNVPLSLAVIAKVATPKMHKKEYQKSLGKIDRSSQLP